MHPNSLNRDMFKPFRSHSSLLGWVFGSVLEDLHRFWRGFLQRDASMRALCSHRPNCSHSVSQKVKRIRRFSAFFGLLSADCKRGRKKGAARKLSKNFLTLFDDFWRFFPCAKIVEKCRKTFWHFLTFFDVAPFRRPLLQSADFGTRPRETFLRPFGFGPRDSFSQVHGTSRLGWPQQSPIFVWPTRTELSRKASKNRKFMGRNISLRAQGFGAGKRGHYERGLLTGGISRISRISKFSRISRKWSDCPLFSRVWGFSRISKFSRISRKWTFLKRPLSKRPLFPNPKDRRCSWTVQIAICLNHFVLIAVCSVEFLVVCWRICTGFKGVSFRETHLWEHFGRTDQIALITCLKKLNVSGASLKRVRKFKIALRDWDF